MRRKVNIEKEKNNNKRKEKKLNKLKNKVVIDKKKIVVVLIGIMVIISIVATNNYTTLGLVLDKEIDSNDAVQIELQTTNNKIVSYGNEVLVYNNGKIITYNNYGKNTGEIKLDDVVDAEISANGKYIQVINKDKGIVYVYKNKYEVARIKIEGKIYSGNINSEGTSVIEYSVNGNKTALGVYDSFGKMQYNIKLSNNIIGKYVLSDNSIYLAYVDVNVHGISASTNINLIDLSNTKEDEANNNIIHTIDNSLAYDIYWNGKNIIVRFEQSYMMYNVGNGKKEIIQISDGQLVNIGEYDKKYAYVGLNEIGDYVLNIKKMASDSITTIPIEDIPKYFKYQNGVAYVCFGKKIEAYNNLGMKIKKYDSDIVITEPIVFNNGRSIAMAISNKLIIFTI